MRLPSKSASFWILMSASALSAFVFGSRTTPGRGVFQPLTLLQRPVAGVARQARQAAAQALAEPLTAEQAAALRNENEELERQVAHQRLRLAELEEHLSAITGLAGQMPDSHVRIVIAPVASYDASPRLATLRVTLNERQARLVRKGQWVLAGAGREAQGQEARDLIDRQWLVGRVAEDPLPRVAVIQLVTDPRFRCEVRAARVLADGTWQLAAEACVVVGQGRGRAIISQAIEDYYKGGYRIVVVPASRDLPVPMTLGRIAGSRPRDDSPHHYDLDVVPWGRAEDLRYVYILTTGP